MIILLKGKKFEDVAEAASQAVLDSITRVSYGCLQQWERCWALCMNSDGDRTDQKAFQPKLCPLIKHIASLSFGPQFAHVGVFNRNGKSALSAISVID
jgi:hypothetical protein